MKKTDGAGNARIFCVLSHGTVSLALMNSSTRRALRLVGVVFVVYGLLVATHEGEFWPFSIYPMFSQAGKSWSRAVVREIPSDAALRWDTLRTWDTLPGSGYATSEVGRIDAIDVANFVGKTQVWTEARGEALRTLLLDPTSPRRLAVYRAHGQIVDGDSIALWFVPIAYLDAQATTLNPALAVKP